MGWCHEFGPQIQEGCSHPMVAGSTSCGCSLCGAICRGRFNGCSVVWERGAVAAPAPRRFAPVVLETRPTMQVPVPVPVPAPTAAPAPIPEPEPVAVPLPPPPSPPPPPPRRPALTMTAHRAGLDTLKRRLSGLRGELDSLGEIVRSRSEDGS